MAEPAGGETLAGGGLRVTVDHGMQVATLRYFSVAGDFAAAVRAATGAPLPQPCAALELPAAGVILAWRSPTETLCLAASAPPLSQLAASLTQAADGCLVDLSGGLKVLRVSGGRIAHLLCRLGGTASVPAMGEARRSRLADVPVLALAVRHAETLLVIDRTLLPHLLGWIGDTLLDFEAEPAGGA
jgi:hypothetical protein